MLRSLSQLSLNFRVFVQAMHIFAPLKLALSFCLSFYLPPDRSPAPKDLVCPQLDLAGTAYTSRVQLLFRCNRIKDVQSQDRYPVLGGLSRGSARQNLFNLGEFPPAI